MRLAQVVAAVASLSALSSAWPSFNFGGKKAVQGVEGFLYRRQATSSTPITTTRLQASTTTTERSITGSTTPSTTGRSTGSASGSAKDTSNGSASGSRAASTGDSKGSKTTGGDSAATTDYDPRLPAGGIQMVTPAAIAGQQFYKIGDHVTFSWNYTSVLAPPTAIDILASCTANSATYTIAVNQSYADSGIVWDTGKFQSSATVPLLTNMYTLIVYDADSSISATPKAGYLAPYDSFAFGMYTPQPYTPWADYQCATCSAGLSQYERQTLSFLFGTVIITVLSFTWFGAGFGVF